MGYYSGNIVRALQGEGYDVVFCSISAAGLSDRGISVPVALQTRSMRFNQVLLYFFMLRDMLRHNRHYFGIFNISHEFIFPFYLARSINIIHDTIQMEYPRSRFVRYLLLFSWFLARRSRVNIADSGATADDLRRLGITARIIYTIFDHIVFSSFREKQGVSLPTELTAVWCGTMAVHKNLALFLALAERHPGHQFGILLPPDDAAAAKQGKLPANVAVYQSLAPEQYLRFISSSRMLISTSLKEGYGMPPMEALLLGVPALVSNIAVYRELYGQFADFFDLSLDSLNCKFLQILERPTDRNVSPDRYMQLARYQGRIEQFLDVVRELWSGTGHPGQGAGTAVDLATHQQRRQFPHAILRRPAELLARLRGV